MPPYDTARYCGETPPPKSVLRVDRRFFQTFVELVDLPYLQIVPQSEAFVPFVPSVVPSMPSMPVGTCPFMPFVPFGTEVRTVQPVVRASSPRLPAFQGPLHSSSAL